MKTKITLITLLIVAFIVSLAWVFPTYNVWRKEQKGKALLREAEWTRQIAIEEAKAKKESAILEAEAEIERAKGVAGANDIIADGLKGNEEYLRYLWITNLDQDGQVIYVPTEAGLPILEAGRR